MARSAPATTILDGARLLARHGGVVEVRILKTRQGTVSGYFDNHEALAQAVEPFDGQANVYITANPVTPELLARAVNRLKPYAAVTTADAQIVRRAWFLADFDPARPRGISATDAEVRQALARRDDVVAFLRELDFPEPALAMSGNGAHAIWPVDMPNDEATRALFERALKALASRFSDAAVTVDQAVFNAARIWKLYGSVSVKGDPTADRPHRRAVLEWVPDELVLLDCDVLERLAAMAPEAPGARAAGGSRGQGPLPPIDVIGAFRARGGYGRALLDGKHTVTCPWHAEHSADSGITETVIFEPSSPGQAWGFRCLHAHCAGKTIADVLRALGLAGAAGNGHAGTISEADIADLDAAPAPETATPATPYTFTSPFPAGHFVKDWITFASTCTDAAHEYHEAAALVCLAAATPRVRARGGPWPYGLRTNLYVLLVGDSTTSRKSTASGIAVDAIDRAAPDVLGPNKATPEAFVEQIARRNGTTVAIVIDEFTGLLESLHHQKFMAGLHELLRTIYDGRPHRYTRHSKRVGKDNRREADEDHVQDPYLTMLGCATGEIFETLTRKDVKSGLMPRFAIAMPATKPRRRGLHEISAPEPGATDRDPAGPTDGRWSPLWGVLSMRQRPGPPPQPTELRVFRGNPGKKRIVKDPTPSTSEGFDPPDWLTDPAAVAEWNQLAPRLHATGRLTDVDRSALAGGCRWWSVWRQADAEIQERGIASVGPQGPVGNPAVGVADKAFRNAMGVFARFGVTPSERARVPESTGDRKPSKWAGALG